MGSTAATAANTLDETSSIARTRSHADYKAQLRVPQIELVKLQRHFISCGDRILVLLEGRDAAGKDGSIKRMTEHLSRWRRSSCSSTEVGTAAPGSNTSWASARRKGTKSSCARCRSARSCSSILASLKLLSTTSTSARTSKSAAWPIASATPLRQWKSSPVDKVAVKHWKAYSEARDAMFMRLHTAVAPWRIVRADDERLARLNLIRDVLSWLPYAGKKSKLARPNPAIAFESTPECIGTERLAQ